jgi:hypothetical protein
VGGLGSNEYLVQFLQKNLNSRIAIRQPASRYVTVTSYVSEHRVDDICSYSAIMRGAVLHGLGLNQIRERVMRRSYGIATNPVFVANRHPTARRFVDVDGVTRCRDVMEWLVCKVYSDSYDRLTLREQKLSKIQF